MPTAKKHKVKKWEVSIMELKDNGRKFKVTRRIPELYVSETKAKKQFDDWLE